MASTYVALLRGINVGGHRVAMADLRGHFADLGLHDVNTFIASGNVIFSTPRATDAAKLERKIEQHLAERLGYEVPTFIRTPAELRAAAVQRPFAAADMDHPSHTVHVAFLRSDAPAGFAREMQARHTEKDEFAVFGRELYWLIRGKTMDSLVTWQKVEKALNIDVTMRNLTSLKKLVATLP